MPREEITYAAAIAEIEKILTEIEKDTPDVDEMTIKVKRVAHLIKICKDKLHKTEEEVDRILRDMEGDEL